MSRFQGRGPSRQYTNTDEDLDQQLEDLEREIAERERSLDALKQHLASEYDEPPAPQPDYGPTSSTPDMRGDPLGDFPPAYSVLDPSQGKRPLEDATDANPRARKSAYAKTAPSSPPTVPQEPSGGPVGPSVYFLMRLTPGSVYCDNINHALRAGVARCEDDNWSLLHECFSQGSQVQPCACIPYFCPLIRTFEIVSCYTLSGGWLFITVLSWKIVLRPQAQIIVVLHLLK